MTQQPISTKWPMSMTDHVILTAREMTIARLIWTMTVPLQLPICWRSWPASGPIVSDTSEISMEKGGLEASLFLCL